jgi:hypothetical protein
MSIATTPIRYGWRIVAGVSLVGASIYVADNVRLILKHVDIVPYFLGIEERCLALQTADGTFPVPRLSFVRSYVTTNDSSTNWGGWVTNQWTNIISWRTDHAMMINADNTLLALVPYYRDPVTFEPYTVTGLFASLAIGDRTNKFTAVPASGTNAATFGPWAWRAYVTAFQERYKLLWALQWASNSYMWASNRTIYIYTAPPPISGLSPRWRGSANAFYGDAGSFYTWDEMEAIADDMFYAATPGTNSDHAPGKFTTKYYPPPPLYKTIGIGAYSARYEIGPFNTNLLHSVKVWATAIKMGMWDFGQDGAVGAENIPVLIIDVTNSLDQWHYSETIGDVNHPTWCGDPPSPSIGHTHTVSHQEWYGDPGAWHLNGTAATNSAFGSNYVFYYCTNKFW